MILPRGFSLQPQFIWNLARLSAGFAVSHVLRRSVVWGMPMSLMIEPINRCNLQCPLCPIGTRELKRAMGTMSLENYVRVLDNVGSSVRVLALWNQGEPTINDKLPEMIRIAHDRGIYTMTSTNGNLLLRRNLIPRLIEAGLDELIFSIDGLTQETYQLYRIGGHLEVVVEAMQQTRKLRDEQKRKTPRIVMQWLPMKHNEHEIPLLRQTAAAWGADEVEIKTTQIYTDSQADQFLPGMEELRRYERKGQSWETKRRYQSCKRLWFSAMIDWDGTVVPCCFDKDEDFSMGNALTGDFRSIWHGDLYHRFREMLLKHGRAKEMCQNCTEGLKSFYVPLREIESSKSQTPTSKR